MASTLRSTSSFGPRTRHSWSDLLVDFVYTQTSDINNSGISNERRKTPLLALGALVWEGDHDDEYRLLGRISFHKSLIKEAAANLDLDRVRNEPGDG